MGFTANRGDNWPVGQCTWLVEQFINMPCRLAGGCDAKTWLDNARALGWQTSNTAQPGSIAVFLPGVAGASGEGHVGLVQSVNADGSFNLIESNFNGVMASLDRSGQLVNLHARTLGGGAASGFIIPPAAAVVNAVPNQVTANAGSGATTSKTNQGDWGPAGMFNWLRDAIGDWAVRIGLFLAGLLIVGIALIYLFRPEAQGVTAHAV